MVIWEFPLPFGLVLGIAFFGPLSLAALSSSGVACTHENIFVNSAASTRPSSEAILYERGMVLGGHTHTISPHGIIYNLLTT